MSFDWRRKVNVLYIFNWNHLVFTLTSVFLFRGRFKCSRLYPGKVCPRLGPEDRSLWDLSSSSPPHVSPKSRAVLWKLHPRVARALGESGQSNISEEFCTEDHTADQKHVWIQLSTRPSGQRGHGPHGAHDHQHPQSSHCNCVPPTVPHKPTRGGEETACGARAGEETSTEEAGRKLSVPQQWLGRAHHPLDPLCRDRGFHVLPWHTAERKHPLSGLKQGGYSVHPSKHSKAQQRVPLWVYSSY